MIMAGVLFKIMKEGGRLILILKTTECELLMAMKKEKDHFTVLKKSPSNSYNNTVNAELYSTHEKRLRVT